MSPIAARTTTPTTEATCSSSTLRLAMELARRQSIDPSVLRARLAAPELSPERPSQASPILMPRFGNLMHELARYSGCRSYGALLGEMVVPHDYEPLRQSFFSAPDLLSGLNAVNLVIQRVGSTQTTQIHRAKKGEVFLGASDLRRGVDMPLQILEFRLSAMLSFVKAWLGPEWTPDRIELPHGDRGSADTFERLSDGASLSFGQSRAGFSIPLELAQLSVYSEQTRFSFRVRHACTVAMEYGCMNADCVGKRLGVSTRNLRRKLREEGTSLRRIYDSLRHERAVKYLSQTQLPIMKIAHYLGYDQHRNFTRAFHRWEGCSPRDYRSSYQWITVD